MGRKGVSIRGNGAIPSIIFTTAPFATKDTKIL